MKRQIGEIFKDNFMSKMPWRVQMPNGQMPNGQMPVKTKREAERIVDSLRNAHPEWFEESTDSHGIDGNLI